MEVVGDRLQFELCAKKDCLIALLTQAISRLAATPLWLAVNQARPRIVEALKIIDTTLIVHRRTTHNKNWHVVRARKACGPAKRHAIYVILNQTRASVFCWLYEAIYIAARENIFCSMPFEKIRSKHPDGYLLKVNHVAERPGSSVIWSTKAGAAGVSHWCRMRVLLARVNCDRMWNVFTIRKELANLGIATDCHQFTNAVRAEICAYPQDGTGGSTHTPRSTSVAVKIVLRGTGRRRSS